MKALTQWLLMLALLLTPLAMQPAAAGVPASNHHGMVASGEGHCQPSSQAKPHLTGDCSMACASALPATDLSSIHTPPKTAMVVEAIDTVSLAGLSPESATPPPRRD